MTVTEMRLQCSTRDHTLSRFSHKPSLVDHLFTGAAERDFVCLTVSRKAYRSQMGFTVLLKYPDMATRG